MICGCDTDTANLWILLISYPVSLAFITVYSLTQPFWRSWMGRALFVQALSLSALLGANLGYRLWGWQLLAREGWLRTCIYATIAAGTWLTMAALLNAMWKFKKERDATSSPS